MKLLKKCLNLCLIVCSRLCRKFIGFCLILLMVVWVLVRICFSKLMGKFIICSSNLMIIIMIIFIKCMRWDMGLWKCVIMWVRVIGKINKFVILKEF